MIRTIAAMFFMAGVVVACARNDMPEPEDGRMLFAENCAICHGADGKGGGPAAEGMDPQPPDLTQISARNGGVFPTSMVLSAIDGYTRQPAAEDMPEFGALLEGPMVPVDTGGPLMTPTPRPLAALAAYLELIQK